MNGIGGRGAALQVLLVEDSPADVRLTQEAFREVNPSLHLHIANDGVEAMSFLKNEGVNARAPRPHMILLDLNLPRMNGRAVLAQVKSDEALKTIPTKILTASDAEADIVKSYELQANCSLSKPVQLDVFEGPVKSINDFWLNQARLPQHQPKRRERQTERCWETRSEEQSMPLQVLLVEDSPGDLRLTQEAFLEVNPFIQLHVVHDGVEAMAFLRKEGANVDVVRPDLILLDLNLPKMDGREVLDQIKTDKRLKTIPTVILTSSQREADVVKSYRLNANCYLSKPMHFDAFRELVKSINDFWLTKVKLPQEKVVEEKETERVKGFVNNSDKAPRIGEK